MDLKEEAAIGGDPANHWYYVSKARAIKRMIASGPTDRILDVGAGSGVFSKMLIEDGISRSATCVDPNYTDAQIAAWPAPGLDYVREVEEVDAELVLMIDVIEHVDDDVALIRDYADRARAGTRFMISVPAFPFLWSSHDDFLEHRRRYTGASLAASVRSAGLVPLKERYFFGLLFPAVAAMRLADRALKGDEPAEHSALKPAPSWLNASLIAIHDLERAAVFPINRLAGVSAFCLAEKPAASMKAAA